MRAERDAIRIMLWRNHLTQTWLMGELEKSGIITDKTELSSILAGRRKGSKVDEVIFTSLAILQKYEEVFNGSTTTQSEG